MLDLTHSDKIALIAYIRYNRLFTIRIENNDNSKRVYLTSKIHVRREWSCGPLFSVDWADSDILLDDDVIQSIINTLGLRKITTWSM
jgi:hypothetical protein